MKLNFWKMQGTGNDFVVINALNTPFNLHYEKIKKVADRHFGVGCDQLLVLEKPRDDKEDFWYRIFNADGSEVGQCGNGARCMGRFIREQGLCTKKEIRLGTITSHVTVTFAEGNLVEVSMGKPEFSAEKIPFLPEKAKNNMIPTSMGKLKFFVLSFGNPHAVTIVPEVAPLDVDKIGGEVTSHPAFPECTNVIFMELFNPGWIKCRIYERGAAETLACGSGVCAAVVAGIEQSLLLDNVLVHVPGGELEVTLRDGEAWLKGPAEKVFEGTINLERF